MAQADLLVDLVKTATSGDQLAFRKAAEGLIQEEKQKGHRLLAERLTKALQPNVTQAARSPVTKMSGSAPQKDLFYETTPERNLDSLMLPEKIRVQIRELVEEQHRAELLHAHNLRARNSILLAGPPGNGKTTLAEALAFELMYPLIVVRYETLVGVSSTRRRNGLAQLSGWRLEAQGLTRSFVETSGDLVQECLRMA
ncbi:AAA family ATPase, partial [Stenotrophomonas maltophilia]|nr:AAA family ATPase [Stenotrophomonas maltophilia]